MGTFKISIRCVLPQLIFWLATIANLSFFLAVVQASNPGIDFNRDIRPILSDKCIRCHGPDSAARQAGLRLDRERDAKTDHSGHTPVVPGHPEQSELYRRITNSDIDERMPPAKSGKTLSVEEIDLLRRWIAERCAMDARLGLLAAKTIASSKTNKSNSLFREKREPNRSGRKSEQRFRKLDRSICASSFGVGTPPAFHASR